MRKNTQYDAIIMEAGAKYNAGPYAKWLKAGKNPPLKKPENIWMLFLKFIMY